MSAVRYVGTQTGRGNVFAVDEDGTTRALRTRFDLRNHSPDGFAWGYYGSGPAQLALALLADASTDAIATAHYQDFKADVVAKLPVDDPWEISKAAIDAWLGKRCA